MVYIGNSNEMALNLGIEIVPNYPVILFLTQRVLGSLGWLCVGRFGLCGLRAFHSKEPRFCGGLF